MKMSSNRKCVDLPRRDALKILGLGGAAFLTPSARLEAAETKLSMPSSKKHARIVIAGGGTAGMDAASRLRRSAPNAQIILIAPNSEHLYQSGQVFVAAGLQRTSENVMKTSEMLPDGVTWLREKVVSFDPDNNTLETEKSGKIRYDVLVVALGCEYDYAAIGGLDRSDIGKNGIASVYLNDIEKGTAEGGDTTRQWFEAIHKNASVKDLNILFAQPDTPLKGVNASLDTLFLCNDYLKGEGPTSKSRDIRKHARFVFLHPGTEILGVKAFDKVLRETMKEAGNIDALPGHTIQSVDTAQKTVRLMTEEGGYTEMPYDFLHVTPPMYAPMVVQQSDLAAGEGEFAGWMAVDPETLQHPTYKNVFGIGDVAGLGRHKSGGAARDQAIVIQDNVAAMLEEKPLPAKYKGYTVAPIKTRYGREILAEYDRRGLDPTFPLDATEPRWIWWQIDLHLMRWVYFHLIMRGMM